MDTLDLTNTVALKQTLHRGFPLSLGVYSAELRPVHNTHSRDASTRTRSPSGTRVTRLFSEESGVTMANTRALYLVLLQLSRVNHPPLRSGQEPRLNKSALFRAPRRPQRCWGSFSASAPPGKHHSLPPCVMSAPVPHKSSSNKAELA